MSMGKYKENLQKRLEVAARISKNAVLQQQAIKDNDIKMLGKLLKRQQGNIDKLLLVTKQGLMSSETEKDTEAKQFEEILDSLLKDAISVNTENVTYAEELKMSIGKSLYNLKISGNAIRNGYFGGVQPRRGRYFDRKK